MALKDALEKVGICNPHLMCSDGMPVIYYSEGHSVIGRAWVVSVKGKSFKDAAWYEHGSKRFGYYGKEGREESLNEALAFVKTLFPDVEMVKGPWPSTYVAKSDLDAALAMLKEKGISPKFVALKTWSGILDASARNETTHYVAAKSKKQAIALLNQAYGHDIMTLHYLNTFWHDCWGNSMNGIEPEIGVWKTVGREPPVRVL
jgi:hypothetical protein